MNKSILIGFAAMAFSAMLLMDACTYDVAAPDYCFKEEVLPIIVSKCAYTGCHVSSGGRRELQDLSTYDNIMKLVTPGKPFQSELYTQIHYGEMPPKDKAQLDKLQKDIIKNWIASGAPNSSNCSACDTTHTYASRIQPLMDKWCVSCHNSTQMGGGYDLSNYNGVKQSILDGRFLGTIQQSAGYSPMPKGSGALSACDQTAIQKWIQAGYPNN
jgi:ribosomal protein S16